MEISKAGSQKNWSLEIPVPSQTLLPTAGLSKVQSRQDPILEIPIVQSDQDPTLGISKIQSRQDWPVVLSQPKRDFQDQSCQDWICKNLASEKNDIEETWQNKAVSSYRNR